MLYKKLLALEQVKRWNFHPHLREQSVAAHGHNVGIIMYLLAEAMGLDANTRDEYAVVGLFHDFTEAITGDIPTLVKKKITEWDAVEALADVEASRIAPQSEMSARIRVYHPMPKLLKLADSLDSWLYARTECNLGNGMFTAIRDELNKRIKLYIHDVACEHEIAEDLLLGFVGCLFAYDFVNCSTKDLPEGMSHV